MRQRLLNNRQQLFEALKDVRKNYAMNELHLGS